MSEMSILKKQNSQSGQAVVEYILLVAISVALILGLMKQLYAPFGNWMQDYMGQYLECLLDAGELPSLGGGSVSGECNSKFASFSVTGGRPPNDPTNGGKNNDRGNTPGQKKSGANANEFANAGGSSGDDSNNIAARARRSGRGDAFNVGTPTGADSGKDGSEDGSGQMQSKLSETSYLRFRKGGSSMVVNQDPDKKNALSQSFLVNNNRKQTAESPMPTSTTIDEEMGPEKKPKKLIVKGQERKTASEEVQESWNISDYFKYGLIVIIVVSVLLFLFGQMAQISKSMEKN